MTNIIHNRIRREMEMMTKLYEATGGRELVSVNLWELGKELNFSNSEIDELDEFLSKHDFIKHVADEGTILITPRGCNEAKHVAVVKLMGDLRQQLSKLGLEGSDHQKIARDITDIEGETKGYNADFTVVQKHLSSTRTVLEGLADSQMAIVLIQQIDALQKRIGA